MSNNSHNDGVAAPTGLEAGVPLSDDVRLADAAYTEVKVLAPKRLLAEQQAVIDLRDLADGRRHIPIVLDMQETEPMQITRCAAGCPLLLVSLASHPALPPSRCCPPPHHSEAHIVRELLHR